MLVCHIMGQSHGESITQSSALHPGGRFPNLHRLMGEVATFHILPT